MRIRRPPAVIGAAGPLAPSSYARLRLVRQLHATGLLSQRPRELDARAARTPADSCSEIDGAPESG